MQDYVLNYKHKGDLYEIHLIDTPGFDDGGDLSDVDILKIISEYVNTGYKLKQQLAGVLYLHDIAKMKIGGAGLRNIRMLEEFIGVGQFNNCTLLTTKWGCTNDPRGEEKREKKLTEDPRFFGGLLLESRQHAEIKRFDPSTKATALEIITPYLENKFTPQICRQMADPRGPKLALGETGAGKIVADQVEKLAQAKRDLVKVQHAKTILAQKYDETLFEEFKQKRKVLRRKINMQRSGRWIMRTTIVGGAIVATVLTLGPGASAFALEPAYEKAVSGQKKAEKKAKEDLRVEFVKKSQHASQLKMTNSDWLFDKNVKQLHDLDTYSLKSGSSDLDILEVAQHGNVVGFAASEGSESALDAADLALPEEYENSESDWGSDLEKE